MCHNKNIIMKATTVNSNLHLASNNTTTSICATGEVKISLENHMKLNLKDILFIPELQMNLLSCLR